jgi:hypothetical protein
VNFWGALIFASLYQDKENRKKVNTNEEEAYKDCVLELPDIYSNDTAGNSVIKLSTVLTTIHRFLHMIFRINVGWFWLSGLAE